MAYHKSLVEYLCHKWPKLNISVVICDTNSPLDSCDRPWIWKGRQIEHIVVICDTNIPLDSCDRPWIWKERQIEDIRGHSNDHGYVQFVVLSIFMAYHKSLVEYLCHKWPRISVVICDTDIPLESCDRPWIWKGRHIEHIRGHLWHRHSTRLLW
jgi:hypothetical protein